MSHSFFPWALKRMPGPMLTLSDVGRAEGIDKGFGSGGSGALVGVRCDQASKVKIWLGLRLTLTSGWAFASAPSSPLVSGLLGPYQSTKFSGPSAMLGLGVAVEDRHLLSEVGRCAPSAGILSSAHCVLPMHDAAPATPANPRSRRPPFSSPRCRAQQKRASNSPDPGCRAGDVAGGALRCQSSLGAPPLAVRRCADASGPRADYFPRRAARRPGYAGR